MDEFHGFNHGVFYRPRKMMQVDVDGTAFGPHSEGDECRKRMCLPVVEQSPADRILKASTGPVPASEEMRQWSSEIRRRRQRASPAEAPKLFE